jgi:hypothetical protein
MRGLAWFAWFGYGVEIVGHYSYGHRPEWTDGEMITTGLFVVALCALVGKK